MKPLLVLLLVVLAPGCASFDDYYLEEFSQEGASSPASCGCRVPTINPVSSAARVPAVSQLPAGQTREPDLLPR